MDKIIRLGALISGGGTNLQAVIDACESKQIDARVVFVGSDNPDAKGFLRAEKHGIPRFVVDYRAIIKKYRASPESCPLPEDADIDAVISRQSLLAKDTPRDKAAAYIAPRVLAEATLLARMESFGFDLLILAGFMRVVTPYLIDRVNAGQQPPRIMNIHPALLPCFPGTDGYGDTFRHGCRVGGCTVHFVDYGEDTGPIIGQRSFPIASDDTLDAIRQRGLEQEWKLFPECIQLFAEKRLRVADGEPDPSGRKRRVVKILPPLKS